MWPCAGPKVQTNVVFLVPLLHLAWRSEHQTCVALHTATWSPTSVTATGSTSKARLIAKKNLPESPTRPLLFLTLRCDVSVSQVAQLSRLLRTVLPGFAVCSLMYYPACKNPATQLQPSSHLADGETEAQSGQDQPFSKASGGFLA